MPVGIRRYLLPFCTFLSILSLVVVTHFVSWANNEMSIDQPVTINFARGDSLSRITQELVRMQNLQPDYGPLYLGILARWQQTSNQLQAGEYELQPGISPIGLLEKLARGEVKTHDVVITDGLTTAETVQQLQSDERLRPIAEFNEMAELADHLDLKFPFTEGVFLPETYQVRKGDGVVTVLQRAHDDLWLTLTEAWQVRTFESPISTVEDLLILASLIEKETGVSEERGQISQVFHLRLTKQMKLQTDPTVIYALGADFDGNIRRCDLKVDSPFNTYKHYGLPPTPIALPSKLSIQAASQPSPGDFLYFVAKGDGSSQFSRTLDAHNQAVREYQLQ